MIIQSSKVDDIRRAKEEYEQKMDAFEEEDKRLSRLYWKDVDTVKKPVVDELTLALAQFDKLDFDIAVDPGYFDSRGLEVRIRCDEYRRDADDYALSWNYRVQIDKDGDVMAESGSWSGLSATTREQLDSLHQTLDALEYLHSVDWKRLLDRQLPDRRSERYKSTLERPERQDFDTQLKEAQMEELAGTNKWFAARVKDSESGRWILRIVKILKATPTRYSCQMMSAYSNLNNVETMDTKYSWTQQVAKRNLKFNDQAIIFEESEDGKTITKVNE